MLGFLSLFACDFLFQPKAYMKTCDESKPLVFSAYSADQGKHCIIVLDWQAFHVVVQIRKAILDFLGMERIALGVIPVYHFQDLLRIAITEIWRVGIDVGLQLLHELIYQHHLQSVCDVNSGER